MKAEPKVPVIRQSIGGVIVGVDAEALGDELLALGGYDHISRAAGQRQLNGRLEFDSRADRAGQGGNLELQSDVQETNLLGVSGPLVGESLQPKGARQAFQAETSLDQLRVGESRRR